MEKLVLASGSPRRRELLEKCHIPFTVFTSDAPEISSETSPEKLVMDLAMQKALAVQQMLENDRALAEGNTLCDAVVLGADTVVSFQGKILGKPKDEKEAFDMLQMLAGKTHQVYTGVALLRGEERECFFEGTDVTFYPMSEEEIRAYIATKEPMDKAGAYGIQGEFAVYVEKISGDYNNVVGLPIAAVYHRLRAFMSKP